MQTRANRHQMQTWIETGQNVLDYTAKAGGSDELLSRDHDDIQSPATTSDESSCCDVLISAEGDPLIPNSAIIEQIYYNGRETWSQLLERARQLPASCYPSTLGNLTIIMKDVPALPQPLPKSKRLRGWAVWQVSSPSHPARCNDWSTKSCSAQQYFSLGFDKPLRCLALASPPQLPQPQGFSILFLCWSYIFSARLLEFQTRSFCYTQSFRQTVPTTAATDHVVDLGGASDKLVRWLSAVLAPSMGWSVKGPLPAWAMYLDANIILVSGHRISYDPKEAPPSASEAIELLIELCTLFSLAPVTEGDVGPIAPATLSFLAALTVPFYRSSNFTPRLSLCLPSPRGPTTDVVDVKSIRQYFVDLRYYMTLSLSNFLGSAIWSIFWQPDIGCNLVSPWYASIFHILEPFLKTSNADTIAKVFLLRRPRIGLWWLGIFLLGDPTIFDWIERFLQTLEERYGYGSTSRPDLVMAAWSGVPQSFLDRTEGRPYSETEDIPRSDILWHRHNFQLSRPTTAWPPLGTTRIKEVELELWPFLQQGSFRDYLHWVWLVKDGQDIQYGFRRDTGRFVREIPDQLDLISSAREQNRGIPDVKVTPSKDATLRMLALAVEDALGEIHLSNAHLDRLEGHGWLKHWRGLEIN
ncbi:hypothetical protein F4802DRAFT_34146 [Xylaria palmicola]|nr:hypothetical protein F4802DRAFT_34146 [Xylaria palmicola]